MNIIEVIILSIIQGLTEFIPVSSSGHLALLPELFGWSDHPTSFDIILHGGTLMALLIYFYPRLKGYITDSTKSEKRNIIKNVIIGSIPATIIAILVVIINRLTNDALDEILKTNQIMIFMLISVGILLIASEFIFKDNKLKIEDLPLPKVIMVGLIQALALIRGTSRSGITLLAGQLQGLSKSEALELSFLLAIPILFLSTIYQIFDFINEGEIGMPAYQIFLGFLISLVSGLLAIKFMMTYIKNNSLIPFGIYRIALGIVAIIILYF